MDGCNQEMNSTHCLSSWATHWATWLCRYHNHQLGQSCTLSWLHFPSSPLLSVSIAVPSIIIVCTYHLVGLVVKASASTAEDPRFDSRWRQDFSGLNHTSDLNIGTSVATLPGAWRSRVSAGTGQPGVSIL